MLLVVLLLRLRSSGPLCSLYPCELRGKADAVQAPNKSHAEEGKAVAEGTS